MNNLQRDKTGARFMEDNNIIKGREAQRWIVDTALEMADAVRHTLGPKGMDMMLVDRMGNKVLTNDGATILKSLETKDPVASIIAEVAKSQEQNAFDGTTTCIVLMGEMLRRADELISRGVHPNAIIKGYRMGLSQAINWSEEIAEEKDAYEAGREAAKTAITGKSAENFVDILSDICSRAALISSPSEMMLLTVHGNPEDAELIEGLVIMKGAATAGMPSQAKGNIALIESEMAPPQAQVSLSDPEQIKQIVEIQQKFLEEIVARLVKADVKVVFCQKNIDSKMLQLLRKNDILAFRNVRRNDMLKMTHALDGQLIADFADFSEADMSVAHVEVVESNANDHVVVKGEGIKAASIIMPAPTEQSGEEFQRALDDAVGVSYLAVQSKKMVKGAGTIQAQLSHRLLSGEDCATADNSKVEAARRAFAEALLIIPQTLAESAGMDLMDVTVKLGNSPELGVNVHDMVLEPMAVFEPLAVVQSAMSGAVENGVSLLRTHSIIMAKPIQEIFAEAERR